MTTNYPQIAADLARLHADLAKPVFHVGDRVSARRLGTTILGEVIGVWESFGGWLEIQPDGLEHTTVPVYFNDPWTVEHVTEIP